MIMRRGESISRSRPGSVIDSSRASNGMLPTGKRRGGYVRKRDAYLVREHDRRRNTQKIMDQMMMPRRRGEQPGTGALGETRPHGGGGSEAMDSDDVDGGDGDGEGGSGGEMSSMRAGGGQPLPVLPGFEEHPAFAKVKDGRVEKVRSGAAKGRGGRRISEAKKAVYLRKAEAAQDREGETVVPFVCVGSINLCVCLHVCVRASERACVGCVRVCVHGG